MGWSKLDISDLIHSNIDLFMYLNGNFNMVHENFNISTGPKIISIYEYWILIAVKSILFTLTRLSDKESSSLGKITKDMEGKISVCMRL